MNQVRWAHVGGGVRDWIADLVKVWVLSGKGVVHRKENFKYILNIINWEILIYKLLY